MKKTQRALRAATVEVPRVLSEILSEQVYATRRSSEETATGNEKAASFFEGYRNGLGYAYRMIKDASAQVEAPQAPSRSIRGKKGEGR